MQHFILAGMQLIAKKRSSSIEFGVIQVRQLTLDRPS